MTAPAPLAELPKPRAPVNLDEVLATACDGVAGISLEVFRSLLSPEDLDDIAAGDIPTARGPIHQGEQGGQRASSPSRRN